MGLLDSTDMSERGKSVSLNLETLNSEYKNLLIAYHQAIINYVNYLQEQSTNSCEGSTDRNCWAIIQNQAFWGVSGISQINVISSEKCLDACATNSECSGATYNPTNNTCILRKGEGSPVPTEGSYAIVSKGQQLLQIIDFLNNRLTAINTQITDTIKQGRELNNTVLSPVGDEESQVLLENYYKLVQERKQISQMLKQHNQAERVIDQGNIVVTQNYYSYILLLALAIIVVLILAYIYVPTTKSSGYQRGGKLSKNTYYVIFFVLLVAFILYQFFKK